MKTVSIVAHKQRLDHVIGRVQDLPEDPEIRSHWARYFCVLVSGFVEQSVQTLCVEYAKKRCGNSQVSRFVAKNIAWFQNAKMEKLLALLDQFDSEFKMTFESQTKGELADAINSVVANRHQIAHGQSVGVSPATIIDWYESVVDVIERLELLLA